MLMAVLLTRTMVLAARAHEDRGDAFVQTSRDSIVLTYGTGNSSGIWVSECVGDQSTTKQMMLNGNSVGDGDGNEL